MSSSSSSSSSTTMAALPLGPAAAIVVGFQLSRKILTDRHRRRAARTEHHVEKDTHPKGAATDAKQPSKKASNKNRPDAPLEEEEKKTSVESCPICYDEVSMENGVLCRDRKHFFCKECLGRHAQESLFGTGNLGIHQETKEAMTELKCMDVDCCSVYTDGDLATILTEKEMERYGELQWNLNLAKANLENLRLCPNPRCGHKAVLPAEMSVFSCPACQLEWCVHCKEAAHGNLTCAQAKRNTRVEQTRHEMEEEMTAALIRQCPNAACGKPMLKDGGCNKLTCSCGWMVCNVCKLQIYGYEHFCQDFDCSHTRCGKCSLWDSTERADQEAINNAQRRGQAEMNRMKHHQQSRREKLLRVLFPVA